MASYQPPSEFLPIFDNSVFTETNGSSTSTGGGLTLAQANLLYLRKNFPDTCTALETFNAGIDTTFLNASGDITASGDVTGTFIYGIPKTTSIQSTANTNFFNLVIGQTTGVLNIGTSSSRSGNINIGTNATSGQLSLGSSTNTQTNLYGSLIYLNDDTEINGNLTITSGSIIGYLTDATAAATYLTQVIAASTYATIASLSSYLTTAAASATYATIASLSSYLTIASAASTYLTQSSATATYLTITSAASTYATIASLSSYLTTANAASTYLTITNAASTYLTQTSANTIYLTKTSAASTYATIASLSSYLTTANAASTYLTISNAASTYLTQSNASSTYATIASLSSYLTTANAASTYLTISNAASTYLTQSNASSTYATIASLSSYLTTTAAATTYLTISNASSTYLTITNAASTYLTQSNATSTYLSIVNAASTYLTQASATSTYLSIVNAASTYLTQANAALTYALNNNPTITGIAYIDRVDPIVDTGDFILANNQTSGIMNIGTKSNRTGAINIGNGATTTASGVFIGNTFMPTTIGGNLNVLGSFSFPTNFNTISSVVNTDNTTIYNNQTTGTLSIGGSTTRTGSISIGVNPTTIANGIFLGNSFNPVTVNGDLTVVGTLTAPSTTTSFNTLTTTLASDTASLYNNQTSGIINLGTSTSRTGAINIGNGATSTAAGIFIGNNNNKVTIQDLTITGTYRGTTIQAPTPGDSLTFCDQQTTGILYLGTTVSGRTGSIVVGASTCLAQFRSPIEALTGITLPSGGDITLTGGDITLTGGEISLSSGDVTLTSGSILVSAGDILTNTIRTTSDTLDADFYSNQTSGVLYIADGPLRTSDVEIHTRGPSGSIILGSTNVKTSILGGITLGTAPTLTLNHLGYFYNFPMLTVTGITGAGQRYNPISNLIGGVNQINDGVYEAVINVVWRYTSNPSAYSMNYNIGIASGVSTGVASPSIVTDITPVSRTNTSTLITGGNNNDNCCSHVVAFTSSGGFVNLFFNITALTITSGTVVINIYGTVKRIG